MPRSMLKCFSTICLFLSFAIFVSFLDRVFNSFNSSRHKPVTKTTNYDEYGRIVPAKRGSPSHSIARDKKSILTGIANKLDINSLRENNNSSKTKLMGLEFHQSLDVFKRDWCRLQKARLDWKEILRPCVNLTVWSPIKPGFGVNQITDPSKSFISGWKIKAAGEFSRFVIQTVSAGNVEKTIGGDSWRIHIQGLSSLAPTIFDHNNGTYEVLFLIIEDGDYEAKIFLDYSLCHGFKDPPPYWFKKGNSQGKNQPDGILKGDRPYLIAPFRDGEKVTFHIPPSANNLRYIDALVKVNYTCDTSCRAAMIWDGFGRWANGQWKPYVKDIILKDNRNQEGIFLSFGDSVSNMFISSLTSGPYGNLCKKTFIACRPVYHWVYDMAKYWGDGVKSPREPLPDDADYDHERVINDIKKTLFNPEITEKSVLMMNMGIHFAAAVNFTNYQRVIEQLIRLLKDDGENKPAKYISNSFKGRFIWKTSTAIHRERFPNPHKDVRRFLTFSRVKLFNAYALSAMCRAGIDVIDVHPISEAYPAGTVSQTDPVHYADNVFRDVEGLLFKMFSP